MFESYIIIPKALKLAECVCVCVHAYVSPQTWTHMGNGREYIQYLCMDYYPRFTDETTPEAQGDWGVCLGLNS